MSSVNGIVISAMEEELEPFKKLLADYQLTRIKVPSGTAYHAHKGRSNIILIQTKVGMVATASALGWALTRYAPRAIVSIGSAGGLSADARVGQVVVGSEYIHGGADGTAFGYVRGQIPGQPESFAGDPDLINAARDIIQDSSPEASEVEIRIGQMLSSDSFITDSTVGDMREAFPAAITADMESHAAAQVACAWGVPFVSIRAISDLCGKPDDQTVSFHAELSEVATSSARIALEILYRAAVLDIVRSSHGPNQHFNKTSLQAALYLMLARRHGADPADTGVLPQRMIDDLTTHLSYLPEDKLEHSLGQIAAGYQLARTDENLALTAKDYDNQRSQIVEMYRDVHKRGTFIWPPTSQTIIKRFNGYWNDALAAIGLKPRRGRARGGLKFSDKDYIFAVRSYVVDAQHGGVQPSFNGYSMWLKRTSRQGSLPSGAAIRQRFGSWKEALEAAALDIDQMSSTGS